MHHKKHLSFTALRKSLSEHFRQIDDRRQSAKVDYSLHDCLMSGFAMMFFQDPSLLTFQKRLQDGIQKNNLATIFDISDIPKDTQMRSVLDAIATWQLHGPFADFLHRLQRGKHLVNYQFFDDSYLVSLDGSQYFSSEKICCPHCLVTESKGHVRYHHQILQSVTLASKCKLSLINPHFGYRCTNGHGGVRPHSGCRFNNLANAIDRRLSVAISLCIFWQLSSLQCKIGTFIAL